MRFPGISLVEQTEQKFRRFESVFRKKTSDCNSQALLLMKAPTKNVRGNTIENQISRQLLFSEFFVKCRSKDVSRFEINSSLHGTIE